MRQLASTLRTLPYGWLRAIPILFALLRQVLAARQRERGRSERDRRASRAICVPIDRPEFVRPDPLIYSQSYLMKLGLAVTWDNPDIELLLDGVPVSSSLIQPGTTYEIVARIWNGSPFAPIIDLPAQFSYLDFGIGAVNVPIGLTTVDLGVKGGPKCPAFASMPWTTPTTPGHYCIQVQLNPADDINYLNNVGQENTTIGKARSPAVFGFTLRNNTRRPQSYRFEVDMYKLAKSAPCGNANNQVARQGRIERHRRDTQLLPVGWLVTVDPGMPTLLSDSTIPMSVIVTPPDDFQGSQQLNVNAFFGDEPAGGITLIVESDA